MIRSSLSDDHTVSRLPTLAEKDLQPETLEALEAVRVNGRLPDVYLQFANSEPALRAYLHMERALLDGSLSARECEAIKLRVSQHTGCDFCLSVHTFKAARLGLDDDSVMHLRRGESIGDTRIDCLMQLLEQLLCQAGSVPESLLADARRVGITDRNLVDLSMAIATIHFTNLTNHLNDSQSLLPPAPPLFADS